MQMVKESFCGPSGIRQPLSNHMATVLKAMNTVVVIIFLVIIIISGTAF